jgi:glycosyltransferase involved in cell wall biosynthesis
VWVTYFLILRLVSLKNPWTEISSFYKTRGTSRANYAEKPLESNKDVRSHILEELPKISIVIPTLNRYKYLKDVLEDLEKQDYTDFETIVIDQSEPFDKNFYNGYDLDLRVVHQQEKALWLARNTAIEMSRSEYILLYDDDSRIDSDWITMHMKALDYYDAELSSGISISTVGAKVPENYSYFHISAQLDTGNVLVKKDVFRNLGLFDRQFEKQRMGDGEYGLRCFLAGYRNISNPLAKRLHLKVGSGGLREMGSWDGIRPKKWLDPRPIPSILYLFRKYHGNKAARLSLLKTIPASIVPYRFKGNKLLLVMGSLISILILPIVFLQVYISWKRSSEKLRQGAIIPELSTNG